MKTFTFHDRTPAMKFFHIVAATPADAIRQLVDLHGAQPYSIVSITPAAR